MSGRSGRGVKRVVVVFGRSVVGRLAGGIGFPDRSQRVDFIRSQRYGVVAFVGSAMSVDYRGSGQLTIAAPRGGGGS